LRPANLAPEEAAKATDRVRKHVDRCTRDFCERMDD